MSKALRPVAAIATLVTTMVISSGCSAGTSNSTDRTAGAQPSGSTSTHEKAVKFAECMRTNGVTAFPDPDASGVLTIDAVANGSSVDTSSAAWKRALAACQDLQPPGFTGTGRTPEQQKAALRFAQCVRDHGVADFPDPAADQPLVDTNRIPSTQNGDLSGLNAAMRPCRSFAAGAGVTRP